MGRAGSGHVGPARLRFRWVLVGLVAVLVALVAGLAVGPVTLAPGDVVTDLLHHAFGTPTAMEPRDDAILWLLRLPRVVLGLLVGAMLSLAGGCYQGVFRNPLADPYLLGVAAGAGLGATTAIVARPGSTVTAPLLVPLAAFAGALLAVGVTYLLGMSGSRHQATATLLLAGVAVAAFCTAIQTYLQQANTDTIQEVYSWLLGRLDTSGWHQVLVLLPYVLVTSVVVLAQRRSLDVLGVGDEEAASLGLHPRRVRIVLIVAATLGTAAAVSVSGLIGFVGIIVPHAVRLVAGASYRVILPLSLLFGAAFLTLADLVARMLMSPAEIPIGVVTAFFGAPFFVVVLRTSRRVTV
ncbi:MAG: iron ABC transporter permease [Actinocatenispora sp.]